MWVKWLWFQILSESCGLFQSWLAPTQGGDCCGPNREAWSNSQASSTSWMYIFEGVVLITALSLEVPQFLVLVKTGIMITVSMICGPVKLSQNEMDLHSIGWCHHASLCGKNCLGFCGSWCPVLALASALMLLPPSLLGQFWSKPSVSVSLSWATMEGHGSHLLCEADAHSLCPCDLDNMVINRGA